jgi:hypothetical protein
MPCQKSDIRGKTVTDMGFEILTVVKTHTVAVWVMTTRELTDIVTFQTREKGLVRISFVTPDTVTHYLLNFAQKFIVIIRIFDFAFHFLPSKCSIG